MTGLSILNVLKRLWEQKLSDTVPARGKKWSGGSHQKAALPSHSLQLKRNGKIPSLPHGTAQDLEKNRGLPQFLRLTFWLCSPTLFPAQSQGQEWHWQKACVSFHLTVTLASASIISGALGQPLLKAADLYLHCAGLAMNLTAPKQQQQARASPQNRGREGGGQLGGEETRRKAPEIDPIRLGRNRVGQRAGAVVKWNRPRWSGGRWYSLDPFLIFSCPFSSVQSFVSAFRNAVFDWQPVTDQLPPKAAWQREVTAQEGI